MLDSTMSLCDNLVSRCPNCNNVSVEETTNICCLCLQRVVPDLPYMLSQNEIISQGRCPYCGMRAIYTRKDNSVRCQKCGWDSRETK